MDALGDYREQQSRSQWWSYIVRATKKDRLITHNTKHIPKTPIMTEQYLKEQIMKGTECLKDIFPDTNSVVHKKVFDPYITGAGTQVNTSTSDKQEAKCQTSR